MPLRTLLRNLPVVVGAVEETTRGGVLGGGWVKGKGHSFAGMHLSTCQYELRGHVHPGLQMLSHGVVE